MLSATAEAAEREVLATVDGAPIFSDEVEPLVGMKLYQLEVDRYTLLKSQIDDLVTQRLLRDEAAERGLTVDALLAAEVTDRIPPFEDAMLDAYLAERPQEAEALAQNPARRARLVTYLDQRRVHQRRLDFIAELKASRDIQINLATPVKPVQEIDLQHMPIRGAADARVTIVHFASFDCSLCAGSAAELQRLLAEFPEQIRWAHANYFNRQAEQALQAAELAHFANDQGRFWPLHDRLFAEQGDLTLDDLPALAQEIGLDSAAFQQAHDAATYITAVRRDMATAQAAGVRRVPTLFVNGRHFDPTFGYEKLRALVREELAKSEAESS